MLTIRSDQMSVFERGSWRQLSRDAARHLRVFFPLECEALGETALASNVDSAIRRARQYGIGLTSDILRYLNLAVVFGWHFDRELAWAGEILTDAGFDAHTRVDLLTERAFEELHYSPDGEATGEAAPETPPEDDETEAGLDGLEDEAMGESVDADQPEPVAWEPEEEPPPLEWDPDVDYTAHESDFRDG